ncbi:MAG: glycoside hydrolase family 26 protein, partial [Ruminococcus sp.]|nr:glycoside hydrolase family 26 protein [Ruminococcus sp.]
IMLDYLDIENSVAINNRSYNADSVPVNPNASAEAKELMKFLSDNYGKYTLTGQYVSSAENTELELIYKNTGQYPAIRFSIIDDAPADSAITPENVDACIQWHEKGGINAITWEWKSPSLQSSVYAQECDFNLLNAMTDVDISKYSQEQVYNLYSEKYISEECYKLMAAIDDIATKQLMPLKEKGIPVLWRPLYDASLGYNSPDGAVYWWGAGGAEAYRWLWEMIYDRLAGYYNLDNLIWVWNGMSDAYSVDSSMFDIASYDLYTGTEKKFGSRCEQLMAVQKYINGKIIAVSECDNVPDMDASFRDNSVWSFFGLWHGEYITDENGEYSEKYTSKDELIRAYNSEGSLTLDEYKTLRAGGQLSAGTRNFSAELQEEYPEPTTETPVYDDYNYDYDYDNDYDYNDYDYDYSYDYDYDYDYSEW